MTNVKLSAPSGITAIQLGAGNVIQVGTDNTVTVDQTEVPALLARGFHVPAPSALDTDIGLTRGGLAERGASGWVELNPGAAGALLKSAGTGADPAWLAQGTSGQILESKGSAADPVWKNDAETLHFNYVGKPGAAAIAFRQITEGCVIPANFAGTKFYANTLFAGAVDFVLSTVNSGGTATAAGTVTTGTTLHTDCTLSTQAAVTLAAGTTLKITAPGTQDASGADIDIAFQLVKN